MGKANRGSFKPKDPRINRGGRAVRADAVFNEYSLHGTVSDRRTATRFGVPYIPESEVLSMWRGDWLARTIIEALPDDAFRRGYDIALDDKDDEEELKSIAEELCLDETCKHAAQLERAFGGAAIMPVFDGALDDFSKPLEMNLISKVLALHVLEPRELMPSRWYSDIRSPKFGQPEVYRIVPISSRGRVSSVSEIHESRLVIFPGKRVSKQLQPGQLDGWGDSILLPVREVIADFGIGWGSAAAILADFSKGVIKKSGLMELLSSDSGKAALTAWRESIDVTTSSLRAVLLDGEDDYTRQSTPISGLDAVLIQLAQVAAGAAEMPMTRLMGMSPGGMNATGESDTRAWYDTVGRAQATKYRRPVEQLLRFIMRSIDGPTGGKEPDVWSIQWKPLWSPSDKEQAETRYVQAQTDAVYLDRGVVTPAEIGESRFGGDTWSAETEIDPGAREAAMMMPRVAGPGPQQEPQPEPGPEEPVE